MILSQNGLDSLEVVSNTIRKKGHPQRAVTVNWSRPPSEGGVENSSLPTLVTTEVRAASGQDDSHFFSRPEGSSVAATRLLSASQGARGLIKHARPVSTTPHWSKAGAGGVY